MPDPSASPPPARRGDDGLGARAAAEAGFQRGVAAANRKNYEAAIEAFRSAYELDGRRDILFAWAQVERLSGDCDAAMPLYRKFLAGDPPARQAEAARLQLERCERVVAERPPVPAPVPVAAPVIETVAPPSPRSLRARLDWQSATLFGAGLAATATGGALWLAGRAAIGDAPSERSWSGYVDALDAGRRRERIGLALLAAGGALLAGGIVRLVFSPASPAQARAPAVPRVVVLAGPWHAAFLVRL